MQRDSRVRMAIGFVAGGALAAGVAAGIVPRSSAPAVQAAAPVSQPTETEWRLPLQGGQSVPAELEIGTDERHRLLVAVGNASMDANDYAAAMRSFERALEIHSDARVWSDLGTCYRYVRRPEDAVAAFERALAAEPQLWEAAFNRAVVLAELGRVEEARAAVARLRNQYPENAQILQLDDVLRKMSAGV